MVEFFVGVLVGVIVMDFAWAYKLGMVQAFVRRIRARFSK